MWLNKTACLLGAALLLVALSACGSASSPQPASPSASPQALPSLTPTPAALPPTASPTQTPAPQPSETPALPSLCSPLAVQPLERLAEIVTQPFIAPRQLDDGTYKDDAHHGLDLGYYTRDGVNFTGTPVLAATSGRVAALIHNRPPYGDAVLVETPYEQIPRHLTQDDFIPAGQSLYVLYAHLQNLQPLTLGQNVTCGQRLAETGLTGFTGGPHLHFETRWGPPGQSFASMAYYHVETSAEERANYTAWRMSGLFRLFDPMLLLSPPGEN